MARSFLIFRVGFVMSLGRKTAGLLKIMVICAMSVGLAFGFNLLRLHPYSFQELSNPQPPGIVELSTAELLAAVDSGQVQIVDARSDMDFAMGHVPGAVSIPSWEIGDELDMLASKLDRRSPVVVYCDGLSCGKSTIMAKKLIAIGFRNVKVYTDGLDGWLSAGRDLEAN